MSELQVTLPDGSVRAVAAGTTPLEIAKSISERLAGDAIVARVNGDLWDLTRGLDADSKLETLTVKNDVTGDQVTTWEYGTTLSNPLDPSSATLARPQVNDDISAFAGMVGMTWLARDAGDSRVDFQALVGTGCRSGRTPNRRRHSRRPER